MDLDAVRTFAAVVDTGRFQHVAADLSIIRQAVSKRIAGLEKDLAVRLFTRAELTIDGDRSCDRLTLPLGQTAGSE